MTEATVLKISDAGEVLAATGAQAIVIMAVLQDGTFEYVTYGEDKAKCKVIGDYMEEFCEKASQSSRSRPSSDGGSTGFRLR
jgi:3-keto-L-gulonate-6-phosphate decarboxylase